MQSINRVWVLGGRGAPGTPHHVEMGGVRRGQKEVLQSVKGPRHRSQVTGLKAALIQGKGLGVSIWGDTSSPGGRQACPRRS